MWRTTITGADDAVDPATLADLSKQFPFVEWAILLSTSRMGKPRYPTFDWITQFLSLRIPNRALHVCGTVADDVMMGHMHPLMYEFERVQINGWRSGGRHALAGVQRNFELILQARSEEGLGSTFLDALTVGRPVSILWDPSGGRGVEQNDWPADRESSFAVGYAGGIGPDNVAETLTALSGRAGLWIDMESGVRTGDCFDLDKVRAVLTAAAPFHSSSSTPV